MLLMPENPQKLVPIGSGVIRLLNYTGKYAFRDNLLRRGVQHPLLVTET